MAVVPHPQIDGIFLVLERDFPPQLGYFLQSIPTCVRSSFFPAVMHSIGTPPPNPPPWRAFHIYISEIVNHPAFLKVIQAPSDPPLINRWVNIPSGLYKGDTGLVISATNCESDKTRLARERELVSELEDVENTKTEIADLEQKQESELTAARQRLSREIEAKEQEVGQLPKHATAANRRAWVAQKAVIDEEVKNLKNSYQASVSEAAHALQEKIKQLRRFQATVDSTRNCLENPLQTCSILVVPRLSMVETLDEEGKKRKRQAKEAGNRTEPRLTPFTAVPWRVKRQQDETRTYHDFPHRTFAYDLEIIHLSADVVKRRLTNTINPTLLNLFLSSQHPRLAAVRSNHIPFPYPSNWCMGFGDRFENVATKQTGIFTVASGSSAAGVELLTDEGDYICVPRQTLFKLVSVGDVVKCRLSDGREVGPGFIVDVSEVEGQRHATVLLHSLGKSDISIEVSLASSAFMYFAF